jgi:hypothetical protein
MHVVYNHAVPNAYVNPDIVSTAGCVEEPYACHTGHPI